jgi:hypothetical protein
MDHGEQPMNERKGWAFLVIGVTLFALAWLLLSLVSYLYGTKFGEALF